MQVKGVTAAGIHYQYTWPSGDIEDYPSWIEYQASAPDGDRLVRIGFGIRPVYGKERARVVVWVDGYPQAEFLGADDFDASGEVLSEIKVAGDPGERMCRYPSEPVPERYSALSVVGLPTRVAGPGVHSAWAVVANVSDHRSMIALAALRRLERDR